MDENLDDLGITVTLSRSILSFLSDLILSCIRYISFSMLYVIFLN
jgi:hypothetical protein